MTVGQAAATAASILGVLKNTTYTGIAAVYVQLHTGDPGASGTANVSGLTTRNAITWGTITAGSMPLNTLAAFTMNTSETITHVSLWTASTAGTFIQSGALASGVPVVNLTTLTFSTFTASQGPIAA